jgi:S1-C subfamily serine protease
MPKSILNKPLLLTLAVTFPIFSIIYGCVMPAEVKDAPVLSPKEIPSGQKAKPVQLKKVMVKIKRGTVIGSWQEGLFCLPGGEITWKGGRYFFDPAELDGVFREEFERANYTVVGDPDALFDDPSSWQAEFLIGAIVTDIDLSICGSAMGVKGEIYLKVDWQVYSRLDRKVVYKTTTEGSYENTEFTDETYDDLVLNVFGMATQNLLADQQFYALVAGETLIAAPSPESFGLLILAKSTPFNRQIENTINDVRMGVVTVFAGEGHGSGFFIDSEGHMLTSAHVVKGAKFIKIRLVTGREVLGEVLRKNPRMDIALVKAGEANMVPLPVNEKELNIGAPVCAIGSPLDKSFSSTFTKGVLSAYRTTEGMTFIQSDVNVLPGQSGCPLVDQKGNAVGICVTGVFLGGAPAGLNFFVPINHALNALNIEMVAPAEVERKRLLAAREIKATPEKTKTEAEKPALEKETPKVAAIPKEVSITRVSLRKKPVGILGEITIKNMLLEYGFFDMSRNVPGSFENHFVDNNDDTVTDKATGLMWQKSGSSSSLYNWSAKEYVKRLNRKRFAGHKNWRMPTVEELASLIEKDRRNGVHIDPVFDSKQIRSWTIDKCESGSGQGAWIIDFKEGTILEASIMSPRIIARGGPDYSKNTMNYVKAVRSVR